MVLLEQLSPSRKKFSGLIFGFNYLEYDDIDHGIYDSKQVALHVQNYLVTNPGIIRWNGEYAQYILLPTLLFKASYVYNSNYMWNEDIKHTVTSFIYSAIYTYIYI